MNKFKVGDLEVVELEKTGEYRFCFEDRHGSLMFDLPAEKVEELRNMCEEVLKHETTPRSGAV